MNTSLTAPAPQEFSQLLKHAIQRSGLRAAAVAARAGISRAHLSRMLSGERGVPAMGIITRLEEILDIQPRGRLFDAAGRHDAVVAKFLKKPDSRVLLRAMVPLTTEEMKFLLSVTEGFARRHAKP